MAALPKEVIKKVVIASLEMVASLPETNIETADFAGLTKDQAHTFLAALKTKLNALPFMMKDGTTNRLAYYDIVLKPDVIEDWPTIGDCIDWMYTNQVIVSNQ